MMKRAGILPIYRVEDDVLQRIKQSILLFDTIGIPHLNSTIEHWDSAHGHNCRHRPTIDALTRLAESDLVFDPMPMSSMIVQGNEHTHGLQRLVDRIYELLEADAAPEPLMDTLVRLNAMALNNADPPMDFASVPILSKEHTSVIDEDRDSEVLQLIIEKLPVPNSDVPLGRVLDFKRDGVNEVHLRGLRLWMYKATTSKEPVTILAEELEYLLAQYSKCMSLHEINHSRSRLQTVVLTGAEWLENIANRQFSKAAKALFSINESKIVLAQAELSAPGKEVAYLYSANKVFGRGNVP
ncbi:MAG: hypothetical protein KF905_00885 [Flavobacteriales bacterium]|nr:hypothetical protein [Flavobacteriales bacterium]